MMSVQVIGQDVCRVCGMPDDHPGLCTRCQKQHPSYTSLRSWAVYAGPLRQALLKLKFRRNIALGEMLSRPLIRFFEILEWKIDFVTPVPISLARLKERGYNQVSSIALPLAMGAGLKFRPKALTKVRETRSQVGLTAGERAKNVVSAFRADPGLVRQKRVLVVDDITTTGATIESCAAALKAAGALEVYGITLARSLND